MGNRCNEIRERLEAYLDSELEERFASEIAQHLETCAECRAILEGIRTTDRLVREGVDADKRDDRQEKLSLSRVIDAIREEPPQSWESQSVERQRGRRFRRKLNIRWAAGLAAATAAVLLALHVGTTPMAPEREKSIPIQASEKGEMKKGEDELALPVVPEEEPKRAGKEKVGLGDQNPFASGEVTEEPEPPAEMEEASDVGEITADQGEPDTDEAWIADVAEDAVFLVEPEGAQETQVRGGRAEPPSVDLPVDDEELQRAAPEAFGNVAPESAERSYFTLDKSRAGRSRDLAAWSWEITTTDTLGPTTGWAEKLESAAEQMREIYDRRLDRAERARRWRLIGDMWEWIGRRENSTDAFDKALDAYLTAASIDPEAADIDSARVRRARRGAMK